MVNNEAIKQYNSKYGFMTGKGEKEIEGKIKSQTADSIKTIKKMGFGSPRHPKRKK